MPVVRYRFSTLQGGTHISACVIDATGEPPKVYEYPTNGLVVDHVTYSFDSKDEAEAHYLCAILNTPCVDAAIKKHQTQGTFGERYIHRTPFEACAIPKFDAQDADHLDLARLSRAAHEKVKQVPLRGGVVSMRRLARATVEPEIQAIDAIARRLLGLEITNKEQ